MALRTPSLRLQRAGYVFLAHGAGHAGDWQVDRHRRSHAVARAFSSLRDQVLEVFAAPVAIVLHLGLFGRQVDADIGDAVGAVQAALDILDWHMAQVIPVTGRVISLVAMIRAPINY